jgi:Ca-activated chloride channel family protein
MFFLLLLVPAILVLRGHLAARTEARISKFVPKRLQPLLVCDPARRTLRFALLLAGTAAAVVAAARPQWTQAIDSSTGRGRDVIIAVDVSRSMLADDLPPTRLKRAQMVAEDLVRQLKSDRIGLVAFAGSAFLQAPVTADHASVLAAMQELSPELIPLPGTNISAALRCAEEAFDHSEAGQRALVLITDGEELEEDSLALAQQLSSKMRIFTVGVGSPDGSILSVPAPNGGVEYIKDASGNVVRSKLDEQRLKQIAEAGGGFYTKLISGPTEVRHIIESGISLMEEHELQLEGRTITAEGYQWPLGLGVLLITLGFTLGEGVRRRSVAVASIILTALAAHGFAPKATAARGDGIQLYADGQYAQAQEAFQSDLTAHPTSPQRAFNLGAAAYKNQNWPEAIDAFGKALQSTDKTLRSRAEYNFANTLVQQARQGRRGRDDTALQQAVDHYEESLRADPGFEDARRNLEFVKKLLTQPPQQDQQQSKDSKEKDSNKKQKPKDQNDQSESDQKDSSESKESEGGDKGEKKSGSEKGEEKEKNSNSKDGNDPKSEDGSQKENKESKGSEGDNQPQGKEENLPDQKEKGELKNSPVDAPDKSQPEKREESQAGGNGQITREQARALLEALRSEDRRVNLWTSENQKQAGKLREGKTW